MLLMQLMVLLSAAINSVFYDSIIGLIGLELMANLDVIHDYILNYRDRIQDDPQFLPTVLKRYCKVIKHINIFNDTFNIVIFFRLFMSLLLNLTGIFVIRENIDDIPIYFAQLCIIFQILIPCLFCEIIVNKTERISAVLYQTNWYDLGVKDQKAFILALGMTQRNYGMKAAGMYDVNIYTFIQIIKLAISYCALLYTFTAK
ncbi:odorant receptor 4-like [Lutzomyia longipalpis]|uniref:odorant receptor 4-like n=1 Tax=Lutzomyia longipalpis TaxID=7200 RepID=UPI00248331E4|nr:odorant receptor 4-like [Lutzomyia longipalpis]